MSLAGLILGAASGARPQLRDGVLLFPNARGPAGALLKAQRYDATTLGHVVVATNDPGPGLFAHELIHVRQAERLGILFGPAYVLLWLLYGYGRHPLERAARLGGRRATQGAPGDAGPGPPLAQAGGVVELLGRAVRQPARVGSGRAVGRLATLDRRPIGLGPKARIRLLLPRPRSERQQQQPEPAAARGDHPQEQAFRSRGQRQDQGDHPGQDE
jgi:hypothetical protein